MIFCLFVYDGWRQLFRDSDAGWHIRNGERIAAGGSIAVGDPYSFSMAGQQWFAWEWLADVVMGLVHRGMGLPGVALLYAALIGGCTYLWFQLSRQAGADFLVTLLASIPMLSTVNLHWLARPHVFGWAFLLAGLLIAERSPVRMTVVQGLAIALFSAAWANVHGSFFLFPVILLLYVVAGVAGRVLFGQTQHRSGKWQAQAAMIAMLASLLTPFGFRLPIHLFRYLTNWELLDRVGEFQTFNFHVSGAGQIVLLLAVCAAGATLAARQGMLARALVCVLFLVIGLRSARGLPIVALAVLPFACGAITEELRTGLGLRERWKRLLWRALDYSERLRAIDRGLNGVALAAIVFVLLLVGASSPAMAARAGFPPKEFPVAAATAVASLPPDARLLAPDKFGGFLIYRFGGERRVFFDGRSDFYGTEFMKRYIRLVEVRPGWEVELDAHKFTHALLPVNYSLIPALRKIGWREAYRDDVAVLLAR